MDSSVTLELLDGEIHFIALPVQTLNLQIIAVRLNMCKCISEAIELFILTAKFEDV